jgi:hypothetical protein
VNSDNLNAALRKQDVQRESSGYLHPMSFLRALLIVSENLCHDDRHRPFGPYRLVRR